MRCEEEETRVLRAGGAALLPGVEATLTELRRRGVRVGIASNCGSDYLGSMLDELGLARWVELGRCLDTPGIKSKAGMIASLLECFGTRAAVFVGDRLGDRDAAWENGLPHVHCARGFAQAGEQVECEAVIDDMQALIPRLERRARWIDDALAGLGLAAARGPRSLGVTGHSGSGKTLFARDVARVLAGRGRAAAVVALDDFQKEPAAGLDLTATNFVPSDRPLEHLTQAFDVDDLVANVLEPHARGEPVAHARGTKKIEVPADAVLVLQGLFLLHPRLRPRLERVVHLEVSEKQALRRVAGRDARAHGPESLLRVRRHFLPTQRAFDEAFPPHAHADRVLDAENALGP
jgi:uridine kinase